MVANKSEEVDFMILLAGPVLPGDQNLLLQKKRIEEKRRVNEETISIGQQIFKKAYDIIKHPDKSDLHPRLTSRFQKEFSTGMTADQVQALVDQWTTPRMIFYLNYNSLAVFRHQVLKGQASPTSLAVPVRDL